MLLACASQEKTSKYYERDTNKVTDAESVDSDSVKYELIIFEPGFESWFITRNLKAAAHSENYYKHWNQIYVSEWNRLYLSGHPLLDNQIYYDPFVDYGFDINYKLYYYFLFVEDKYNITIVRR